MAKITKILILAALIGLIILPIKTIAQEEPTPPISKEPSIPGTIQGTGTFFEITDSEYLNVSLQSTEEITVVLESVPKTISLNIEASTLTNSTTLTIRELEPSKAYYKFENSYKNKTVFVSDENGGYSWIQDLFQPHHIWFQPEDNGTVFLPEDCSDYGTWDESTKTCTLIQDLTESVEITTNNIALDCDGYSIAGAGAGYGIYLNHRDGVTIQNCTITNFSLGIYLFFSTNNIITVNHVHNNSLNIHLYSSNDNSFTGNNISNSNLAVGLYLYSSGQNDIADNNINNNRHDGILIWYLSDNNIVTGNNISNNGSYGIRLTYSRSNKIYHNNVIENYRQAYIADGTNNFFDDGYPPGGNYWSDYIERYPDAQEINGSGIWDTPYTFYGGQDNYPFIEESGWAVPPILNVPKYYQFTVNDPLVDPNWPDEQYDYLVWPRNQIKFWGCALTSGVMALRFHDVITGPDPQNTPGVELDANPSTLNAWLKEEEGYDQQGNLKWKYFNKYSDFRVLFNGLQDRKYIPLDQIITTLDEDLANNLPVIIKTQYIRGGQTKTHYVVAKGKIGDTWSINDPASQVKETLTDYQNQILGIRRFKPGDGSPVTNLAFYAASPVELFLVDPFGRRTGINPSTSQFILEIPESSYGEDEIGADFEEMGTIGPVKTVDIQNPLDGNYQLQVIGIALGTYSLTADTSDEAGAFESISINGVTNEGTVSTFDIEFSGAPGAVPEITRIATFESLRQDIINARQLNLIDNKGVKNSLLKKVNAAQKAKRRGRIHASENILEALINEIRAQKSKHIDLKIATIFIEDVQYIIEHL